MIKRFSFLFSLDGRMTMLQMNEVLIKLPRLNHLELDIEDPFDVTEREKWQDIVRRLDLDIEAPADIIDGNQWRYLVSHLHRFDFRFRLATPMDETVLNSYRTAFWLQEKRWVVGLQNTVSSSTLFTIPRFAPKTVHYTVDYDPPCSAALSSSSSDYLQTFIETLILPEPCPFTDQFPNVTSLASETTEPMEQDHLLSYLNLPKLSSLSLSTTSLLQVLSSTLLFPRIHQLKIQTVTSKGSMERLCAIFPNLEHLQVTVNSNEAIFFAIDHLKSLSIGKFLHQDRSALAAFHADEFFHHSVRLTANRDFTFSISDRQLTLWMVSI